MCASYTVANKLARNSSPLVMVIKECIDEIAKIMCPDKLLKFEMMCFSRRTIKRQISNINMEVVKSLRQHIGEMEFLRLFEM